MKIAVLGLALCTAITALAQDKPADFASQTPLSLSGEGPWYRIELPLAVQLNARQTDLSDVRVFNAEGQPQAYSITPRQPAPEQEPTPIEVNWFALYSTQEAGDTAPVIRIERSSNGAVIEVQPQSDIEAGEEVLRGWLLDTSAIKAPLEQLVIDWSTEQEGFQNFSIEASDDLQHWRNWGEGQVARLSFADEVVEQREVGLPGQSARYLRLLWRSPHSAPLLISAHLLSASSDTPATPLTRVATGQGQRRKPQRVCLATAHRLADRPRQNRHHPAQQPGTGDALRPARCREALAADQQRPAVSLVAEQQRRFAGPAATVRTHRSAAQAGGG